MSRRALASTFAAALCVLTAAFAGLSAAPATAASTSSMFVTFYGWYDNTPPGNDIAYPQIHSGAGGKGTFSDPITFATSTSELKAGTKIYSPRVKKFFIMEDSCQECGADWSGHGPNGGPGLRHIDLWLGGKGGNEMKAIDCEDALTHYNSDGTPTMEPIVVNPSSSETYDSTPIFNTSTGECYGGAQPDKMVGQFRSTSTGTCMDDPGNSTSSGTALKLAACSGAAEQQFTFEGAFLMIHNLCAAYSGSSIVLNTCSGGPSQQWSVNPNGTISDIQSGGKCMQASGSSVKSASCGSSGIKWTFPSTGGGNGDFSVGVSPASGSVTQGGTTHATVTTSGSGTSVALSASGAPSGVSVSFSPSTVTAGGTSTMTVSASSSAATGSATITVKGSGGSFSHTSSYSLSVLSPAGGTLLSQGKPALASSEGGSSYVATNAVDGSTATRWASVSNVDPQWLRVDLGSVQAISKVRLIWDLSCAPTYQIQTSNDGSTFATAYSTTTGAGGTEDIVVSASTRYVRMFGTSRCRPTAGYSLQEFQVYGPGSTPTDSLLSQGRPSSASSDGGSGYVAANAFDGSTSTRWASISKVDPQWLRVDLGSTQTVTHVKLIWDLSCAPSYQVQVSADGSTFTTIFSTTTGDGGTDDLTGLSGSGRYVRMLGTTRCRTSYGYSLQEMQVFGH
jgi:hypothetical protein